MEPNQTLKAFAQQRKTIKKKKKDNLPTEWKKIFANNVTGKGLISKISKHIIQLSIKKKFTPKNGHKT